MAIEDPPGTTTEPRRGMAITALVLATFAAATSWIPVVDVAALVVGVVAVVLGVLALLRAARGEAGGFGLAVAAVVVGTLAVLVSIAVIVLTVLLMDAMTDGGLF